ncbi:hypothetical protein GQ607_009437 [Colletotrichum asianum]|uniref:Uncharacterized protein n=1 Tax=Colletotrichum asianum TaxID=702518 RepID=A0A8H3ZKL8_9PEZI|nr:hypothetical protein GQ607_009437 [Colletotrichum asianum]
MKTFRTCQTSSAYCYLNHSRVIPGSRAPLRGRSHTSIHRRPGVNIKRLCQRCNVLSPNEARSPSLLLLHRICNFDKPWAPPPRTRIRI